MISAARQDRRLPVHTLSPNLGVVQMSGNRRPSSPTPGNIEGAHEEQQPSILRHRAPAFSRSWCPWTRGLAGGVNQPRAEIEAYSADLAQKPYCVVFTKMDLLGDDPPPPIDRPDADVMAISAAGRKGLNSY